MQCLISPKTTVGISWSLHAVFREISVFVNMHSVIVLSLSGEFQEEIFFKIVLTIFLFVGQKCEAYFTYSEFKFAIFNEKYNFLAQLIDIRYLPQIKFRCYFPISAMVMISGLAMPQGSEAESDCNAVCPHVYSPICATDGNSTKVFTSPCGMRRAGCLEGKGRYLHFNLFWTRSGDEVKKCRNSRQELIRRIISHSFSLKKCIVRRMKRIAQISTNISKKSAINCKVPHHRRNGRILSRVQPYYGYYFQELKCAASKNFIYVISAKQDSIHFEPHWNISN